MNSRGQHFHTFAVALANQTFLLVDPPTINPVTSLQLCHTRSSRPPSRHLHVWILPRLNSQWRDSDRKLRPLIVPRAPLGLPLWKTEVHGRERRSPAFSAAPRPQSCSWSQDNLNRNPRLCLGRPRGE